jgi:HD-GYP domain-containing protein (c-di-GMP phosphodiesterase class II)
VGRVVVKVAILNALSIARPYKKVLSVEMVFEVVTREMVKKFPPDLF